MEDVKTNVDKGEALDLLQIHGAHASFELVHIHATLAEAIEGMEQSGARVVLVTGSNNALPGSVYGVLTRDRIEAGFRIRV